MRFGRQPPRRVARVATVRAQVLPGPEGEPKILDRV
jgi:hypothetical protein